MLHEDRGPPSQPPCRSPPLCSQTLGGASIPEPLRRDLLRLLTATSEEQARLIGELTQRNPGMANLLIDLEADDLLRAQVEVELLRSL